jgi:ribosomal protein S18 acetylase RimI-like enzyme
MRICSVRIRPGTLEDLGFLRKMVYEAAYWRPSLERPPLEEALAHSELARILRDWGRRPGDAAEIAVAADGRRVGAAWYRFWSPADHSYGFVDERLPELGIGVAVKSRGQGVGTALLRALVDRATGEGVPGLSLSVERDNPAIRLYEGLGFQPVASEDNSWTMVLDLKAGR